MEILSSPQQYLFHLQTTSSGEAKRMWRKKIKDKWENKCAYCGCDEHLTIDHIVPRSKEDQILLKIVFVPVILVIRTKVILLGKNGIIPRSFLVCRDMKKLKNGLNQIHLQICSYIVQEGIMQLE